MREEGRGQRSVTQVYTHYAAYFASSTGECFLAGLCLNVHMHM